MMMMMMIEGMMMMTDDDADDDDADWGSHYVLCVVGLPRPVSMIMYIFVPVICAVCYAY